MRRLVVNADDLGLTIGVNDGIFDAHRHGILTSASLFANAPATPDAVRRTRLHPSLGVGVHLALVDGVPVLPPTHVPSLVEGDGRFRHSWKPFIVACLRGQVSLAQVEYELTAQVQRVLGAGITPTHLDAHKHVHGYPPIFAIVAGLAARFGIPVVRVPYERSFPLRVPSGDRRTRSTVRRQALLNAATWPWARRNARTADSLDLRTPQFIGRMHTGVLDKPALHALLRSTGPGITELMVHPGYLDEALAHTGTRLLESRARELDLLCSLETRAVIAGERIDLVRHDLAHTVRRSVRHVS
jgi:chitin disaccharide deacetylase